MPTNRGRGGHKPDSPALLALEADATAAPSLSPSGSTGEDRGPERSSNGWARGEGETWQLCRGGH